MQHGLSLKAQHVKNLSETYNNHRAEFEEQLNAHRLGRRGGEPFNIKADFETLEPLVLPIDRLQTLAFDRLSLPTRPLSVLPMLIRSVESLNRTIDERNELIAEFRRTGPHSPAELIHFTSASATRLGILTTATVRL